MRILNGRKRTEVDVGQFHRLAAAYAAVALDLGTGDGRSVVRAARKRPDVLFIGLDADPSRMRRPSRHAPPNALFVVAAAEALPVELDGAVAALSIHFPWGSLLRGLVAPSPTILGGIARVLQPGGAVIALLSIAERDGLEPLGPASIDRAAYRRSGLHVTAWRPASRDEIAASDSSWAKRLGRDRRTWLLTVSRAQEKGRLSAALLDIA